MTNREFYNAITNETTLPTDVIEFANAAIAKMDAANDKRKNKPSKVAIANEPIIARIVDEILSDSPKTAAEVAEILEVSTQKASALLRQVVASGKAQTTEVTLPKKGTVKAYLAA